MALPAYPTQLSFSQIQTELGDSESLALSQLYSGGGLVPSGAIGFPFGVSTNIPSSGQIALSNFHNYQVPTFDVFVTSTTTNLNLRNYAILSGWNQTQPLRVTINSGVYVFATDTTSPAITITGTYPGGITLINYGIIMGCGGRGGNGGTIFSNGIDGGPAIEYNNISQTLIIQNYYYILGGGGGGAGSIYSNNSEGPGGGGGAGGGRGGAAYGKYDPFTTSEFISGGTGGLAGNIGNDPSSVSITSPFTGIQYMAGGGGGRLILAPGLVTTGGRGATTGPTVARGGRAGGGGGTSITGGVVLDNFNDGLGGSTTPIGSGSTTAGNNVSGLKAAGGGGYGAAGGNATYNGVTSVGGAAGPSIRRVGTGSVVSATNASGAYRFGPVVVI